MHFDEASYVKRVAQIVSYALAQYSFLLVLAVPADDVLQERLLELIWGFKGFLTAFSKLSSTTLLLPSFKSSTMLRYSAS